MRVLVAILLFWSSNSIRELTLTSIYIYIRDQTQIQVFKLSNRKFIGKQFKFYVFNRLMLVILSWFIFFLHFFGTTVNKSISKQKKIYFNRCYMCSFFFFCFYWFRLTSTLMHPFNVWYGVWAILDFCYKLYGCYCYFFFHEFKNRRHYCIMIDSWKAKRQLISKFNIQSEKIIDLI